jgi:hypothetical protein
VEGPPRRPAEHEEVPRLELHVGPGSTAAGGIPEAWRRRHRRPRAPDGSDHPARRGR